MLAAVVAADAAQAIGKIAVAAVETGSVPFAHRSRTRREFCCHANKSDHRRRNAILIKTTIKKKVRNAKR